ncbi:MFS general substrate transporter [Sporormia fimetaria CBS 119925]|uniref:MFS general substrate transporter n=1 Tax=Sporormia fimetaria CBS 119925 TaxID=1340428 RepID=A0A6A6UYR0_9PLEO|nr:MFS general substrate transporter [Sporormia fimetaria CBS 119925]
MDTPFNKSQQSLENPFKTPYTNAKVEPVYPSSWNLAVILIALCLTTFCVALDNTIIATAIPSITDEFHSLEDVGWYGAVYLLTTCALQLQFGTIYSMFSTKWVFLSALFVFEIGSLICGAAPNSLALIIGRAIAGLGSAGLFSGGLITIAFITPVEKRSVYIGLMGGVYGVASVAGPLLGGLFTNNATWRWCFYINLPLGGISAVIILLVLKLPSPNNGAPRHAGQILKQLDLEGSAAFIPAIICLMLSLHWGGVTYAWSSPRIIALLTLFSLLTLAFIAIQIWKRDLATVPPKMISQRTMAGGSAFAFLLGGSFFLLVYYIPVWLQAILGNSPIRSGINTLPFLISQIASMMVTGAIIPHVGHYMPFLFLSSIFMSIGAGLLTTFTVHIATSKWIGYTILYGLGAGFGFQLPTLAAQTVLPLEDVGKGTATIMFFQLLGGAVFISAAQNVFLNSLVKGLVEVGVKEPMGVVHAGATGVRRVVEEGLLEGVREAYNGALVKTFEIALILSCLSVLGAGVMQWRSVKGGKGDVAAVA